MKLRQSLAMGAVSALIAPALAVVAAPAALASPVPPAPSATPAGPTVDVKAPTVVGAGGDRIEFDVDVRGVGEGTAELYFTLGYHDFFKKHEGLAREFSLQYLHKEEGAPDKWQDVDFNVLSNEGGNPRVKVEDEVFTADRTLKLRLSVAAPKVGPAAPAARARAARVKDRAARQLGKMAEAPERKLPPLRPCDTVQRGFTLTSELMTEGDEVEQQAPELLAKDTDDVNVGVPSIDLVGLEGDVVAGGQPKVFKATVCNPTESDYEHVVPGLAFGPYEAATITEKDLTLEASPAGKDKFVPVKLTAVTENDQTLLVADFGGVESGIKLPGKGELKNVTMDLRIAAAGSAKIGDWGAIATIDLLRTPNVEAGLDRANFKVVAAGPGQPTSSPSTTPGQPTPAPTTTPAQPAPAPDDLASTGGNLMAGVAGIVLLFAGAGAFLVVRRRRQQAAA